jgi:hypothetical protein
MARHTFHNLPPLLGWSLLIVANPPPPEAEIASFNYFIHLTTAINFIIHPAIYEALFALNFFV